MNFTLPRSSFHKSVQTAARALSGQSSLPVLANVLLRAEGDTVTLTATDLEIGISATVPATVAEPGQVTVPAKLLLELLPALPEAPVGLADDTHHGVVLHCAKSNYRLLGLPPEEYPPLPEVVGEVSFSLPASELARMLRSVLHAVGKDDTRPITTGVLFSLAGSRLQMVATDLHRLAVRSCDVADAQEERDVVVPGRALVEVARLLPAGETLIPIRLDANQVEFLTPDVRLVSRLLEGTYPKFERVIPVKWTTRLTLPVDALHQAIRRAAVVARENAHKVQLAACGETLVVTAQSGEVGNAREELEIAREGEEIAVTLNERYVQDVLGVLEGESFTVELTAPLKPVKILTESDPNFSYVLMPMENL